MREHLRFHGRAVLSTYIEPWYYLSNLATDGVTNSVFACSSIFLDVLKDKIILINKLFPRISRKWYFRFNIGEFDDKMDAAIQNTLTSCKRKVALIDLFVEYQDLFTYSNQWVGLSLLSYANSYLILILFN